MSESSERGKQFELKVARIIRSKLGARVQRDRRSGAGTNRSDITNYYNDIPLHLELKDHETIKVKEWFRQADQSSSFNQTPTLVFACDEEILATLRLSDLVNFVKEIADQKAEIDDLRAPSTFNVVTDAGKTVAKVHASPNIQPVVEKKIERGATTCREGHLADDYGYCNIITCKYSRGYRKPKAKKGK